MIIALIIHYSPMFEKCDLNVFNIVVVVIIDIIYIRLIANNLTNKIHVLCGDRLDIVTAGNNYIFLLRPSSFAV